MDLRTHFPPSPQALLDCSPLVQGVSALCPPPCELAYEASSPNSGASTQQEEPSCVWGAGRGRVRGSQGVCDLLEPLAGRSSSRTSVLVGRDMRIALSLQLRKPRFRDVVQPEGGGTRALQPSMHGSPTPHCVPSRAGLEKRPRSARPAAVLEIWLEVCSGGCGH